MWNRRQTLKASGSALTFTVLSGCLNLFNDRLEAGDLYIQNESDRAATVTITLVKFSEDSDAARNRERTPSSDEPSIWERQEKYSVQAGKKQFVRDFVDQTGSYFISAELNDGQRAAIMEGWYQAGESGEEIAENWIRVYIDSQGVLDIGAGHSD